MDELRTHSGIEWRGDVGVVNYDMSMSVLFYKKPVPSPQKSLQQGRPIHEDILYVRIAPIGERALNVVDRPATDADKMRWALQYAQYERGAPQEGPEGTPIEFLHPSEPSIAANLRASGVNTIEQCANLSAHAIGEIMGGQQYCNDSKRYLDMANKGVGVAKFQRELDERDREIQTLKRQIEELRGQVSASAKAPTSGLSLEQVQAMIAQAMQQPVHMPQAPFDPQTAMINSTHASVDEKKPVRKRPKLG